MKRLRDAMAGLLLMIVALVPLPACAPGAGGANPMGALAGVVLSVGASVGSYFLIKEITD